uniref:GDT1 family protein n=1 Tax=Hemiselmis tepida TaxID=464990 RepID=A0A7S0Z2M0_9CRYP
MGGDMGLPASPRSAGGSPLDFWSVCAKVFMLMFVAEMGDRTQIAMIVLATRHDPFFVCFGSIAGFLVVTAVAVVCGDWLAGKVSERLVTLVGGGLFLLFALLTLLQAAKVIHSDL